MNRAAIAGVAVAVLAAAGVGFLARAIPRGKPVEPVISSAAAAEEATIYFQDPDGGHRTR